MGNETNIEVLRGIAAKMEAWAGDAGQFYMRDFGRQIREVAALQASHSADK